MKFKIVGIACVPHYLYFLFGATSGVSTGALAVYTLLIFCASMICCVSALLAIDLESLETKFHFLRLPFKAELLLTVPPTASVLAIALLVVHDLLNLPTDGIFSDVASSIFVTIMFGGFFPFLLGSAVVLAKVFVRITDV